MPIRVYGGILNAGQTASLGVQPCPAESRSLSVAVLSAYAATASTTGVKLYVGVSIDGGLTV